MIFKTAHSPCRLLLSFRELLQFGSLERFKAKQIAEAWMFVKQYIIEEFVPNDHVSRATDMFRKLKQPTSLKKFLSEFQKVALPDIPGCDARDTCYFRLE